MNINRDTVEILVCKTWENIKNRFLNEEILLSSERSLCFNFAWEMAILLNCNRNFIADFEWNIFKELDSDDTFLDLRLYTDSDFQIAFEFKLPKKGERSKSNHNQTRAKIYRDLDRLYWLVRNDKYNVQYAYFICITNERHYINYQTGKDEKFQTSHETYIKQDLLLRNNNNTSGEKAIKRDLRLPEFIFWWEKIQRQDEVWYWLCPYPIIKQG